MSVSYAEVFSDSFTYHSIKLVLYFVYRIKLNVLMFDLSFTNNSTLNNPGKQLYPVIFF